MWGAVLGARGTLVEETRPGFCSFITKVASNAHLESGPCWLVDFEAMTWSLLLFSQLFYLHLPLRLFIVCILCSHWSLAVRLRSCLLVYLIAQENRWRRGVGAEVLLGECLPVACKGAMFFLHLGDFSWSVQPVNKALVQGSAPFGQIRGMQWLIMGQTGRSDLSKICLWSQGPHVYLRWSRQGSQPSWPQPHSMSHFTGRAKHVPIRQVCRFTVVAALWLGVEPGCVGQRRGSWCRGRWGFTLAAVFLVHPFLTVWS